MAQPLSIAFVWHMHQPYYRNIRTGECSMPWVRLHATKDYVDMVKRLELFPSIHQTFNFVPSLLDQLDAYLHEDHSGAAADPPQQARASSDTFLDHSRKPADALSSDEQRFVLEWFFLANIEQMIKPYPRYHDLLMKRGLQVPREAWPAVQKRFKPQEYLDLQVWFNLAWIDPWLRSQHPELARLEAKGSHFTEEEKQLVLAMHRQLIAQVVPLHQQAAARGQIELTTSPYYHPIMPLLCDLRAAHAALPDLPLPETSFRHPEDARWHLLRAMARHAQCFGAAPAGVWPPEGSVSEAAVSVAIDAQVRWMATDEEILWRTLKTSRSAEALYRPHRLQRANGTLAMVFRDRELSDLLGFVYSRWDPRAAAVDFLRRLESIRQRLDPSRPALVTIVLDGENAWEGYPRDGHDFFLRLYETLAGDDRFRCVTVSEFLSQYPIGETPSLPELFSGSWIDANFATWIGHPEKNSAWTHLARARQALEALGPEDPRRDAVWRSLGIAEGSDWMWWFGDTHFSLQADEFDRLFRMHLSSCYEVAGLPVPAALALPIRRPQQLAQQPTNLIHPHLDGRETSYYEWLYAGRIDLTAQHGALQRGQQCLKTLYVGFDHEQYYIRVDPDRIALSQLVQWTLEFSLGHNVQVRVMASPEPLQASIEEIPAAVHAGQLAPTRLQNVMATMQGQAPETIPCALDTILEIAIPLKHLALAPGEPLSMTMTLRTHEEAIERYPAEGSFDLATTIDREAYNWSV